MSRPPHTGDTPLTDSSPSALHSHGLSEDDAPPERAPRPVTLAVLSTAPEYRADARLWRTVIFHAVLHREDEEGVLGLLEERPVDYLLLDPDLGRSRFLDAIKRARPEVKLLFLTDDPRAPKLLKLRGRGHPFVTLPRNDTPRRLARRLLELLFPRAEERKGVAGMTLSFTGGEGEGRKAFPLENLSPHGLAWRVALEGFDHSLLPGGTIGNLRIERGEATLLSAGRAVIRHVTALAGENGITVGYRVGARLQPEAAANPPLDEKLFDDPITVTALLKQALERAELQFTAAYGEPLLHPGRWDLEHGPSAGSHRFIGEWPESWREGMVVKCLFELNNWGCEFLAAIVGRERPDALRLRAPSVIKGVKRREIPRHRPSEHSGFLVRFHAPFAERLIEARPRDFTVHGFAFEIDEQWGPILPGTRLEAIEVEGVEAPFIGGSGTVRHVRAVHRRGRRYYRCGVGFGRLAVEQGLGTVDALVSDKLEHVASGQGMRLEDLWSFFYASNFIYPKKEEAMRPIMKEVKRNYATLLEDRNSSIMRTVVVKSEETPVEAHVSLLHAYHGTWIMQHLASTGMRNRNRNAVKEAYLGTVNVLNQLGDSHWMRAYFQPTKSFPDRIAGVFARRVEDRKLSNLNTYAYLSSHVESRDDYTLPLSVRPATGDDLPHIEGYFASRESLAEFLAEDGAEGEMGLESIGREYSRYRLVRRRRIVVAEHRGQLCGAASLEFSSFGLNLSEVTNRCAIHAWDREPLALISLAEHARRAYGAMGYPFCIAMVRPEHARPLIARGFNHSRDYSCWTLRRDLFPEYADYIEKAFSTRL